MRAMYICMESEILWYGLYSNNLKSHGLSVDPYDRCIENSTINGEKCTIVWYVDNNKVFHIDEEVNTKLNDTIAERFGELTVSRGNNQKFQGIDIEFLSNRKLSLFIKYYIK